MRKRNAAVKDAVAEECFCEGRNAVDFRAKMGAGRKA